MTILAVTAPTSTARYSVQVATDGDQVRAAQRLRHRVFAEELGATLHSEIPGLDVDELDIHCDHLVITEDTSGEVVGTYRMLPPGRTDRLYSDGEFHLAPLAPLRDALVETGRSCVHPDHRTGAVINLMWAGIARYMHLHGQRWLAGCASVPLHDGGFAASAVWDVVRTKHLAPPLLRVTPRQPYALNPLPEVSKRELVAAVPPLLRGYLRLGAWIGGEPA